MSKFSFNAGSPDSLPRFSLRAFKKFRPYIQAAIDSHPTPIVINPAEIHLSPETFCCRFRDIISALLHPSNTWPDRISPDLLTSTFACAGCPSDSAFILTHNGANVYVGPNKRTLIPATPTFATAELTVESRNPHFDAVASPETLHAICHLINIGVIQNQFFEFSNVSPSLSSTLEATYPAISLLSEASLTIIS